jgi:outer membrane protein assembly factor BamA
MATVCSRVLATALAVALVLATAAATLGQPAAAAAAAGAGARVSAIEVSGLVRTRRETVLRLARVREGDPWREGLDAEARQLLLNAGIFYEVTVVPERQGDDVRLLVAVREKWTLVAVPLFVVKDGETTWGGTVVESNFLGTASRLIAVVTVKEGEPGGRLLYIDPHLGGTPSQLFAALARTDERIGVWDADAEIGSYRRQTDGGTLALGYRFARRTSASLGLRLTNFDFGEPRDAAEPPADARERAVSLMLRHDGADLEEERRRGVSGELVLEAGASALGDEVGRTAASGTVRWARTVRGAHTVSASGSFLWTDTVDYDAGFRSPAAFLRGYEADRFRPDRLIGGTVEYQVPVGRFREATISVVPFADAALLRDAFHRCAWDDAQADAGVALAVYLRRVAFPVLQLYGAYGFSTGDVLPGFSLGVGF